MNLEKMKRLTHSVLNRLIIKEYHSKATKSSQISLINEIHNRLDSSEGELGSLSKYYFDGNGKGIRPVLILGMANAINEHLGKFPEVVLQKQRNIAAITEMFHTASLMHDDVIDGAPTRRNKPSINYKWNKHKSVHTGDYITFTANQMLGDINNFEIIYSMSQILSDLVLGEFQQMSSKSKTLEDRFAIYLDKTYNKTASLIANSCKSVALLATNDESLSKAAFSFGKNIGIAFQLVDDWLDFMGNELNTGKPVGIDMKLGIATGPVLFACQDFPELEDIIIRRFKKEDDVKRALEMVFSSNGIDQTLNFAKEYAEKAIKDLDQLKSSNCKSQLISLVDDIIDRES